MKHKEAITYAQSRENAFIDDLFSMGLDEAVIEEILIASRRCYFDPRDEIAFTWNTNDINHAADRHLTEQEKLEGLAYLESSDNDHYTEYQIIHDYLNTLPENLWSTVDKLIEVLSANSYTLKKEFLDKLIYITSHNRVFSVAESEYYSLFEDYYIEYLDFSYEEFEKRFNVLQNDEAEAEESLYNYFSALLKSMTDIEILEYVKEHFLDDVIEDRLLSEIDDHCEVFN